MEKEQVVKKLKALCQLDIDAMHAYMQAKERIDQNDIKDTILSFQADHSRHVQELSDMIRTYGENPPEFSRDFKGFLLEGFTSIRSLTGTEGALKALRSGEKMTNRQYNDAVKSDFPPDVMVLLQRNFDDEKRHLGYIENALNLRTWKKAA